MNQALERNVLAAEKFLDVHGRILRERFQSGAISLCSSTYHPFRPDVTIPKNFWIRFSAVLRKKLGRQSWLEY